MSAQGAVPESEPVQACDLLVLGGSLWSPNAPGTVTNDGAVAITGSEIVAVGLRRDVLGRWKAARTIDATGSIVVPGFVDAHVHLGAFLFSGQPYRPATGPGPFSGASDMSRILPMAARMGRVPVPDDLVRDAVRPALAAMLLSGFTGVVDAGGPGVNGVVEAAEELGIRAAIGPSLADQWHDDDGRITRQVDTDGLLADAETAIRAHDGRGEGRIRSVVSAVEPVGCSDELLRGIATLTRDHQLPTHVHSHVSPASNVVHDATFHRSATERLLDEGLLTERCTVMHAGALTDDDITAFADSGVTVNYNPIGNAMLGFGVTPGRSTSRLLQAGVRIALGSDYSPSTVATPFELLRAALMLQRDLAARDDALTLEQALGMAYSADACLGRPRALGRLAVGQLADVIVVDVTGLHHLGSAHPVPALALRGRPGDVRSVIVNGRIVVDGGCLVTADETILNSTADRARARFQGRHG